MNESKECCDNCTQGHLVLDKKQTSTIVSGLLLCSFLLFVVGYFLGKRKAVEELSSFSKQNLFNNQMHYALNRLQVVDASPPEQELVSDNHDLQAEKAPLPKTVDPKIAYQKNQNSKIEESSLFQAHLISFGSLTGAQQFVNRLQRNGINTTIIKHEGKVPGPQKSSKMIYWYQVVTDNVSHEDVKKLVEAIKQIIKLNDVRIVKVNDGSTSRETDQKQAV